MLLAGTALVAGWVDCVKPRTRKGLSGILAQVTPIGWFLLLWIVLLTAASAWLARENERELEDYRQQIKEQLVNVGDTQKDNIAVERKHTAIDDFVLEIKTLVRDARNRLEKNDAKHGNDNQKRWAFPQAHGRLVKALQQYDEQTNQIESAYEFQPPSIDLNVLRESLQGEMDPMKLSEFALLYTELLADCDTLENAVDTAAASYRRQLRVRGSND